MIVPTCHSGWPSVCACCSSDLRQLESGVVFRHGLSDNIGLSAEILLIHHSIVTHDEGHNSGRLYTRLDRLRTQKLLGHLAANDVAFRAARSIFPLTREDLVIVAAVRSRRSSLTFGITFSNG